MIYSKWSLPRITTFLHSMGPPYINSLNTKIFLCRDALGQQTNRCIAILDPLLVRKVRDHGSKYSGLTLKPYYFNQWELPPYPISSKIGGQLKIMIPEDLPITEMQTLSVCVEKLQPLLQLKILEERDFHLYAPKLDRTTGLISS